ncbi:MAG: AAA family ATPase [Sedimenticola sp.]
MNNLSGRLFALCGVDGSGKSTLVTGVKDALQAQGLPAVTLKKSMKNNVDSVEQLWCEKRDWSEGPFARAVSVASTYDFLHHYIHCILPQLQQEHIVLCDRYAYCYAAYMACVDADSDFMSMLRNVIQPLKTFYIKVPADVAVARHHERGGPSDDETPEVIRKFLMGYEQVFAWQDKIVTVDNTRPFATSVDTIVSEIIKCHEQQ